MIMSTEGNANQIVKELDLQKPIYLKTASYGHFGNSAYTWEQPKQLKL